MSLTLHHRDLLAPGAVVRLTRATLTPRRPKPLHDHDFHELFWVQNGTVRHHLPDSAETLREGDVVFLRPGDLHGLQGRGEEPMVVSLCLHPDLIDGLGAAHPQLQGQFFWGPTPARAHRGIRERTTLNQLALELERSRGDSLAATAFLLPLLSALLGEAVNAPPATPDWLVAACRAARDPDVFREGAAGLVAQTGRAHAHVNRQMQKHFGQTPSDYVNAIRMDHAARMLTADTDPLADVAEAVGLPNLSHFHKVFRAHWGVTPARYRQRYQRDVVQPE